MSVSEAAGSKPQMAAGLAQGVATLSMSETVPFTRYDKFVLPIDGSVFWVRTEETKLFAGSLHVALDRRQVEDNTESVNRVIFTAPFPVDDLNAISPETLWIAEQDGQTWAFSAQGKYYKQADLYHYTGEAVNPSLLDLLIADHDEIDERVVVSNSLPAWLTLSTEDLPVYPSFLVPANIRPPFVVIHVERTEYLQDVPLDLPIYVRDLYAEPEYWVEGYTEDPIKLPLEVERHQPSQLMRDRVVVTTYGLRNHDAIGFVQRCLDYMRDGDTIGLMAGPNMVDEKRTQREITAIALKKTVGFDVSYLQNTVFDVALKLIRAATVRYYVEA